MTRRFDAPSSASVALKYDASCGKMQHLSANAHACVRIDFDE
jgi:hypothetical protein